MVSKGARVEESRVQVATEVLELLRKSSKQSVLSFLYPSKQALHSAQDLFMSIWEWLLEYGAQLSAHLLLSPSFWWHWCCTGPCLFQLLLVSSASNPQCSPAHTCAESRHMAVHYIHPRSDCCRRFTVPSLCLGIARLPPAKGVLLYHQ